MKKTIRSTIYYWLPLLIGVAILPVPLLRDFHIESALVVALAGCFWSAWRSCDKKPRKDDVHRIGFILRTLYLIGIPLFIYALIRDCLSWHGIGFWILYPMPSVLLGYSLGRLLRTWDVPARRLIAMVILVFIAFGVLIFEFFHFPQVYFFNHVWGGWPGPIYDETVRVTWSLLFFRGLTLLWVALLWVVPACFQSTRSKVAALSCVVLLALGYTQLAEMGVISPRSYLQEQLGGVMEMPHFKIYYDEDGFSKDEINFIAEKHEFYFREITRRLDLAPASITRKTESYLYKHPWQKKRLVGAKFTSYVPVWLREDQLHIAKPQIDGSLKHELVHVLAKQFGNTLFNASWSVGLIEGLAVAVAPDASPVTTIDQIVVSEKPYPTASEMRHALSPLGFYGGRSAVNYTQSGSFVRYLLTAYPAASFKEAYARGDIARAYGQRVDDLVSGWHNTLDTVKVDSTDRRVAQRLYGFPSLFEQECPHVQSRFARLWDQYEFFLAEEDTLSALQYMESAHNESPQNEYVQNRWAFLNLKAGNIHKVQQQANLSDSTVDGLLLSADAFALGGDKRRAAEYVDEAARRLREKPDSTVRAALNTRQDSVQWKYYRGIIYSHQSVDDSVFAGLYPRTQIRAIEQALQSEQWERAERYAAVVIRAKLNLVYFDAYLRLTEQLVFRANSALADRWLQKIEALPLRSRYRQRLVELKRWAREVEEK